MIEPVLYSYVRCPYAWRARLALIFAGFNCELREVDLANKPQEMLQLSPKGTVPVLQLADGRIIDQSLDVMQWAAQRDAAEHLWPTDNPQQQEAINELIAALDNEFGRNSYLYRFRKADDPHPAGYYRQHCVTFLQQLEILLAKNRFLFSDQIGFADLAVYPFVRGFADFDPAGFTADGFNYLSSWLAILAADTRVVQSAQANPPWQNGDNPVYLMPT